MKHIIWLCFLCAAVFAAQTTFTANVNLRNLAWTSTVDQATANQDRNIDCAYYFYQIGRKDLLQKDGAGAFVLTSGGDLRIDPALTNAQVSAVIAESLAKHFKEKTDIGFIAFQVARRNDEVNTTRKAKPQP